MKPAQVEDVWRRLRSKRRKVVSITVAWDGIPRLTDNSFSIAKPFAVICGENGVGKSTLLHTLFNACVAPARRREAAVFVREEEGTIGLVRMELSAGPWGGARTIISNDLVREHFDTPADGLRVALFDPAMHVPIILNAIRGDANFSEELEAVGPKHYSVDQVGELSYAVGREYETIKSFEIEGYGGLGVFPYFKVRVAGIEYGSEDMGFGELSILLAYWTMSRMPGGSLILLEEPETFIAPKSQARLANLAAKFALDSDLVIVATTHSPSIVGRFKLDEITLVSRNRHTVSLTTPASAHHLERRLELVSADRRLWLVEDRTAAKMLGYFLLEAGLSAISDVLIAGNNDAVFEGATNLRPGDGARVSILGVLDGDDRSRHDVVPANVTFLPGDTSPESLMKEFVSSSEASVLGAAIGVDASALTLALGAAEGEEAHQWIHAMRAELQIPLEQFVAGVMRAWGAQNADASAAFVKVLRLLAGVE